MNKGKICIPVVASKANEFLGRIPVVLKEGDIAELRFDSLEEDQLGIALEGLESLKFGKPLIATFRPEEQGGFRKLSRAQRLEFWAAAKGFELIDIEADIFADCKKPPDAKTICSLHDFSGSLRSLEAVYEKLLASGCDILKIALSIEDAGDSIPLWKLIERAKQDGVQIIPVAMGEAGKWARILGPAYGAFLTYASFDPASETAPGQMKASELHGLYRFGELTRDTAIYGIISGNTTYSLSPCIHNTAFGANGLNAVFLPFQVGCLDAFFRKMLRPESSEADLRFAGLAVTIPHKEAVIPYLDHIDETARMIGAVNTVKVANGKLTGFNTDAEGFIGPLRSIFGSLRGGRVALLGSGGAAKACCFALGSEGAEASLFSGKEIRAEEFAERSFSGFDIVVNATPIGTKGELESQTPLRADQLAGVKLVYDLVYNPYETMLLKEARAAGAKTLGGMDMLIAQAAAQQEIWTGKKLPVNEVLAAVKEKLG